MKSISGILYKKTQNCALFHITNFSTEIQEILRNQLSFICYGRSCSESGKDVYNYTNTLQEFLVRYEDKSQKIKKGMIGELLSHVVINEFFSDEYHVVSPFFNKEERSIKKGFDVVLSSTADFSIWLTEVKSGGLRKDKDSIHTSYELLDTAKRDLLTRLNKTNRSLWLNAINDAKIAYDSHADLKDSILEILYDYGSKSGKNNSLSSTDINVFLVSALFAPLTDLVTFPMIESKSKEIVISNRFKKLFVLSIQKGTFSKVYNFLKQESTK